MNLVPLMFLSVVFTLKADEASERRLERLKKRMAKSEEKKAEDSKPSDDKAKTEKETETKESPKVEEQKDLTKPEDSKTQEKKEDTKPDEKKPEETKKEEEEKKDSPKPEEKKAEESKPSTSSSIGEGGKADLAKALTDQTGSTERDWTESIAEREKVESEGEEILKKTQSSSLKTNEFVEKISNCHSESASVINDAYQQYSEPVSTYIQMNQEVGRYLKITSGETDSKIKDQTKDLEKESKSLSEATERVKKAIEDVDKLEKDNEEHFTKSQEKSVLVIKKLGEVQLAYNDISRAKTITQAQELITKMKSALDQCNTANKELEELAEKIKALGKDLTEKVAAVKSSSQDAQNLSEKITEIMSLIEKAKLEQSSKSESKVVKNLKKMADFVGKKKASAQEKPTTFGMAIINFFVNAANGVKDFFVRLFIISTNQASNINKPSPETPSVDEKAKETKDQSSKKTSEASEDKKEEKVQENKESSDKEKEKEKDKETSKDNADSKEKNDSTKADENKDEKTTEKKSEKTNFEEIKNALDQFFGSLKTLFLKTFKYLGESYSGFANKKSVSSPEQKPTSKK